MAGIKLRPYDVSDDTLTVTSEATGFDKENMQDRRTALYWKSTSTADQNIDIDLGSAQTLDYLALYHNLSNNTTVTIYHDDNPSYSSPTQAGNAFFIAASNRPIAVVDFDEVNDRYWRVQLTTLPAVAEVSFIFRGDSFDVTTRYALGDSVSRDFSGTKLVHSAAGYRRAIQNWAERKIWRFSYENLPTADKDKIVNAILAVDGPRLPFIFTDPDGAHHFVRFGLSALTPVEIADELFNITGMILEEEF